MSKENLIELMEAVAGDEHLAQKWQTVQNYEQLKELARQQGYDLGNLSEAEAARTIGVVTGEISEELSDEELELVAGGFKNSDGILHFNIGMPPTFASPEGPYKRG